MAKVGWLGCDAVTACMGRSTFDRFDRLDVLTRLRAQTGIKRSGMTR